MRSDGDRWQCLRGPWAGVSDKGTGVEPSGGTELAAELGRTGGDCQRQRDGYGKKGRNRDRCRKREKRKDGWTDGCGEREKVRLAVKKEMESKRREGETCAERGEKEKWP